MFTRHIRMLLAGMASLVLVSCGSSGGGSPPPPAQPPPPPVDLTLPITAENAQATTVSVLEAITSSAELTDLVSVFGFPGIGASNPVGPAAAPADIIEQVLPCDSGQVSTIWDDADNNLMLSTGDTIDANFENCFFNSFAATFNGLVSLMNIVVTGDLINQVGPWGFAGTMTFNMLTASDTIDTVTLNGALGFDFNSDDNIIVNAEVTSLLLDVQVGATTESLSDYILTQVLDINSLMQTISGSGTYTSSVLNGSVDFETLQDFVVIGDDNPSSGQLLISDAQSSVLVTVIDNINVRLEIDTNLDGTIDSTIVVSWAELDID